MTDTAIKVENISKRYRIGLKEELHDSLIGKIGSLLQSPFSNMAKLKKLSHYENGNDKDDIIWALKDISFEVKRGEVLGIIGPNGAGKSTLLKILAQITQPSSGHIQLNGRVASLLEVGTGFHPELTGRENIYLNGTILGMTKKEIDSKLDEIIDFSGVEKFIDTPVKRYSSGMGVRLAFSVAAHLEPEILLIDEVLAVGDAEFQKKCLGKMDEIAGKGRTVLFVTHNLNAVSMICERLILIKRGRICKSGEPRDVINYYISGRRLTKSSHIWIENNSAPSNNYVLLKSVNFYNSKMNNVQQISILEGCAIEVVYKCFTTRLKLTVVIHVLNKEGTIIFGSNDFVNADWYRKNRSVGTVRSICKIPPNYFNDGEHYISVFINSYNPDERHISVKEIISFNVLDDKKGGGARGPYQGNYWPGIVRPLLNWIIMEE